jgi:hypothetical protein
MADYSGQIAVVNRPSITPLISTKADSTPYHVAMIASTQTPLIAVYDEDSPNTDKSLDWEGLKASTQTPLIAVYDEDSPNTDKSLDWEGLKASTQTPLISTKADSTPYHVAMIASIRTPLIAKFPYVVEAVGNSSVSITCTGNATDKYETTQGNSYVSVTCSAHATYYNLPTYHVTNLSELQAMSSHLDESIILEANIDASGTGVGFTPIGTLAVPFTGSFDGGGFTINNLFINNTAVERVGLFGVVKKSSGLSIIQNVTLANCNITSTRLTTGVLIGHAEATNPENLIVHNCVVSGGSVTGRSQFDSTGVGGLIGYAKKATVSNCRSSAAVSDSGVESKTGGFVGETIGSIYSQCYSTGTVTNTISTFDGLSHNTGGFAGKVLTDNNILLCFSTSNVIVNTNSLSLSNVGGFIGYSSSDSFILSCFSLGNVSYTGGPKIEDYSGNILVGGGYFGYNKNVWLLNDTGSSIDITAQSWLIGGSGYDCRKIVKKAGKIYILVVTGGYSGWYRLYRYNPDMTLDTSWFYPNGYLEVFFSFSSLDFWVSDNGRVVTYESGAGYQLTMYEANGDIVGDPPYPVTTGLVASPYQASISDDGYLFTYGSYGSGTVYVQAWDNDSNALLWSGPHYGLNETIGYGVLFPNGYSVATNWRSSFPQSSLASYIIATKTGTILNNSTYGPIHTSQPTDDPEGDTLGAGMCYIQPDAYSPTDGWYNRSSDGIHKLIWNATYNAVGQQYWYNDSGASYDLCMMGDGNMIVAGNNGATYLDEDGETAKLRIFSRELVKLRQLQDLTDTIPASLQTVAYTDVNKEWLHENLCAGGFIGYSASSDTPVEIIDCFSRGTVCVSGVNEVYSKIGGFAGYFGDNCIMINCYSVGQVYSPAVEGGGFIGVVGTATVITNCYWDKQTSGWLTSAGGTGKTTSVMKTPALIPVTYENWDFTNVWEMLPEV